MIFENEAYAEGWIVMGEDNQLPNEDKSSAGEPGIAKVDTAQVDTAKVDTARVDMGRRDALKSIGALAGAAPAVAVLLTPSASRAGGCGSPDEMCDGHKAPGWDLGSGAPGGNSGLLGNAKEN